MYTYTYIYINKHIYIYIHICIYIGKDRILQRELDLAQSNEIEIINRLTTCKRLIQQLNKELDELKIDNGHKDLEISDLKENFRKISEKYLNPDKYADKYNSQLNDVWRYLVRELTKLKVSIIHYMYLRTYMNVY
jgi:predicted RNase H-like nuclease (RuvC/YqgF family)